MLGVRPAPGQGVKLLDPRDVTREYPACGVLANKADHTRSGDGGPLDIPVRDS